MKVKLISHGSDKESVISLTSLIRKELGIVLDEANKLVDSCPTEFEVEDNKAHYLVESLRKLGANVELVAQGKDASSGDSNHIFAQLCNQLQALHLDNDYDRFVYPNISSEQRHALSIFFKIGDDEQVAYYRIITADKSTPEKLIITDKGIRYRQFYQFWGFGLINADVNSKPKNEWITLWDEFDKVTYNPEDKRFYFIKDEENVGWLSRSCMIKKESPETCFSFAKILTDICSYYKNDADKLNEILDLEANGSFKEALSGIDELLKTITSRYKLCYLYCIQGRVLFCSTTQIKDEDKVKEIVEKAVASLESSLRLMSDDNKDLLPEINFWMGMALNRIGDISCRDYYIKALDTNSPDDEDIVKDSMDLLNRLEEEATGPDGIWNDYAVDVGYKDRQYLMVSNNLKGCYDPIIKVFREKYMPNVQFPIGHPKIGLLYVAHPYRKGLYLPYNEASNTFFLEKIHELCYLAQCLGATEINITSIKGQTVSEMQSSSIKVDGEINVKVSGGGASAANAEDEKFKHSHNKNIGVKQSFNPTVKPYVPEGLVWYEQMPNWKQLVNSRIHGDALEYTEIVNTSQSTFQANNTSNDISAHFKNLIVAINANVHTNYSSQLDEAQNTEWKVEIKFRSNSLLKDDPSAGGKGNAQQKPSQSQADSLSEMESKYLEEVKFCLEDGEGIDGTARKFLDRLCKHYNISTERAAEIEDMAKPKLSDDEKEYLDSVKEVLSDGEMSPRDRKLLNRLRDSLGISEERAAELEKSV